MAPIWHRIEIDELDHLRYCLKGACESGDREDLWFWLGILSAEPRERLRKNALFRSEAARVASHKTAHDLRRDYGPYANTQETAAMDLLVALYAMDAPVPAWLRGSWRENGLELQRALWAYIAERDGPAAERGLRFEHGPKNQRADALSRIMAKEYRDWVKRHGSAPTALELLDHLGDYGPQSVIQEIDEDRTIWWLHRSREKKTTFGAFRNRLTKIRKKRHS